MPATKRLHATGTRSLGVEAGFTLLEAMVVVALIAILASLALPSYQTMIANNRVSTSASELQALMLFARAEAVYRRTPTEVSANQSTWQVQAASNVLRTAELPSAVAVTQSPSATIRFEVNGNASNQYSLAISLSGATRLECVRISRAGLVQLERKEAGQSC